MKCVFHSDCNKDRSLVWGNLPIPSYKLTPSFIPVQEMKCSEPQLSPMPFSSTKSLPGGMAAVLLILHLPTFFLILVQGTSNHFVQKTMFLMYKSSVSLRFNPTGKLDLCLNPRKPLGEGELYHF